MELDVMSGATTLPKMQTLAKKAEDAGFGALWLTESGRTAYLSCAAAGLATESIGIGTAVAVAFPRSPMITASIAWELAESTGGRFTLGLGTQVKAHIERRYSANFGRPGPHMREYVQALRAIFRAFRGEEKLKFEGDYYNFSLLPAQWSPGPIDVDDPPIFISAVLPWMSRMAGEFCDGVHIHPFHSAGYLRDQQIPNIVEGTERAGRSMEDVTLEIPVMTAVGSNDEEIAATREHARGMIGFYGSTRTYSPVFEQHGFDGLSEQLHARMAEGDMVGMIGLITDDVLDHYIVSGTWSELGPKLAERYGGLAPNIRLMSYTANTQLKNDPDVFEKWSQVTAALR